MTVAELIAILRNEPQGSIVVFRDTEEGITFDISDVTDTTHLPPAALSALHGPTTILAGPARED